MLHSLSAQVSYYSDYIQRHGEWEYAGVYADEAFTGTKEDRPEFQRLINDCRDGKIDMVITKSIARFARNTVTLLEIVRELKLLGIGIYFEKESIHSLAGWRVDAYHPRSYAWKKAALFQKTANGESESALHRKLVSLRFMFGYRIEKGEVEVDRRRRTSFG